MGSEENYFQIKNFEIQEKIEISERVEQLIQETKADAVDLAKALSEQIKKGEVEIETKGRQIIVRIREKGSFPSGSAASK